MTLRARIIVAACVGIGIVAAAALASDADLQQYNGSPSWNTDLTAASTLLPRDGKRVTADSNAPGSAPVNRSLKQIKDMIIALHDGIFGSRAGSQLKTVRALYADGTGGASHSKTPGWLVSSIGVEAETGQMKSRTGFLSDSSGSGSCAVNHQRLIYTNTAASGTNPSATTGLTNELRAVNIVKLWATVSFNGMGTVATEDGANIFVPSATGGKLRITPTSTFANALYSVVSSCIIGTTPKASATRLSDKATNRFDITIDGADPSSDAGSCDVIVMARQTTP